MSEFKGTKGDWKLGAATEEGIFISASPPEDRDIATVWRYDNDFLEKQESLSNAKLIACAPEMLEILIDIHEQLKDTYVLHANTNYHLVQLIKKATE